MGKFNRNARHGIQRIQISIAAAAVAVGLVQSQVAWATSYTWNATGGTTGTWSASGNNGNWTPTSTSAWDSSTDGVSSSAVFNTASLNAAVSGTVYADGITFSTAGVLSGGTIDLVGTTPTITANANATIGSVLAGSTGLTSNGSAVLTLTGSNSYTGGTITTQSTLVGAASLALNSASGTSIPGNVSNNGWITIGNANQQFGAGSVMTFTATTTGSGYGVLELDGTNQTLAGISGGNSASGVGIVENGQLNSAGTNATLTLNGSGSYTFAGILRNQSTKTLALVMSGSGTQTLSGTDSYTGGTTISAGTLVATVAAISTGAITLNGGTFKASAAGTFTNNIVADNVAGNVIDLTAGAVTLSGGLSGSGAIALKGYASVNSTFLSGNNESYTGTVTITGAAPYFNAGTAGSAGAAWVFNSTYLALNTNANTTYDFGALSGSATVYNSYAVTSTLSAGGANSNATYSGAIGTGGGSGTVALTKIGTGTQTLGGTNTYTGPTAINAGSLMVTGSLASGSAVTVGAATGSTTAILGGSGTVNGPVTVTGSGGTNTVGHIAPSGFTGSSGATLTLTNALTLNTGSVLDFNLNSSTSSGNDKVSITGSGAVAYGAAGILNINAYAGFLTAGTYVLINDASSTTPTGGTGWTIGTNSDASSAARSYTVAVSGKNLDLTVAADTLTWNGAAGSVFDTSSLNWYDSRTASTIAFVNGNPTVFQDAQLGGSGNVTNSNITMGVTNGVLPSSVTFNNTSGGVAYTITSNDSTNKGITGTTGLTLAGTGSVTLVGTNTYTGTTVLNAGTLVIATNASLGSTTATIAPLTFNGGTLMYAASSTSTDISGRTVTIGSGGAPIDINGNNVTYANAIGNSGSGGLTLLDSGAAATLTLSGANTYTGGTTVNSGTLNLAYASGGGIGTIGGILTINSGATVNLTHADALGYNVGSQVTTVNVTGGTLNNTTAGNEGFVTNFSLTGGTVSSTGGGSFYLSSGYGITSLASGTTSLISCPINLDMASPLAAIINVAQGTTSSGIDLNISGILSNTGGVTKSGAGVLELSNLNTYSGATTVSTGTLILAGNAGDASGGILGNSAITVSSGAFLNLNGTDVLGYGSSSALTVYGTVSKINNQSEGLGRPITLSGGTLTSSGTFSSNGAWDFYAGSISTAAGTTNSISGTGAFSVRTTGLYFNLGDASTLTVSIPIVPNSVVPTTGLNVRGSGPSYTGTMVLTAANTYTGATTLSGGTLVLAYAGNNTLLATNAVTLGAATTSGVLQLGSSANTSNQTLSALLTTGNGGSVVGGNSAVSTLTINNTLADAFSGTLGGAGTNQNNLALIQTGGGLLTLSGSNSFTGGATTTQSALSGTASLALNSASGTSIPGNIANNGWITIGNANQQFGSSSVMTFTATNSGSGYGVLELDGHNQTLAGISGGNSALGVGIVENAQINSASANATLMLDGDGTYTFAGTLRNQSTQTLALAMSGSGTQTLSSANTYTGGTTISAGTLVAGNANALGSSPGTLTMNGGTLNVGSFSVTQPSQLTVTGGGTITGSGGLLYLGSTGINAASATGNLTFTSGANVWFNAGQTWQVASGQTITFNNAGGGSSATFMVSGGGTVIEKVGLNLAGGTGLSALVIGANTTYELSGTAYNMLTAVTNGYLPVTINAGGVLSANNASSNAHNLSLLTLNGGTLTSINGPGGTANDGGFGNFVLNGVTVGGSMQSTISATTISIHTGSFNVGSTGAGTDLLVSSSIISGALTKTGVGTMAVTGSNTYTGATTIDNGTLVAGGNAPASGNGVLGNSAGGAIALGDATSISSNLSPSLLVGGAFTVGRNIAVGSAGTSTSGVYTLGGNTANASTFSGIITLQQSLTFSQLAGGTLNLTGNITSGASGTQNVTFNNAGAVSQSAGIVGGGTGTIAVLQSGAGTTTLSGSNTYTGGTTVNSGTLVAGAASAYSFSTLISGALGINSAVTVNTGGTLSLGGFDTQIGSITGSGGTIALGANTLTVGGDNTSPAPFSGVITGGGNLVKIGTGSLQLSAASPGYSGTTLVNQGFLTGSTGSFGSGNLTVNPTGISNTAIDAATVSSSQSIASTAIVTVNTNSAFAIGTVQFQDLTPTIAQLNGNGNVQLLGQNSGVGTALTITGGGTFSGVISDNGPGIGGVASLNVTGGTLTLSGASTFNGGAAVNGGTLLANGPAVSGVSSPTGLGGVTVNTGGRLGGNGTIGNGVNTGNVVSINGGTLSPGSGAGSVDPDNGVGVLTTGDINLVSGQYNWTLNSGTPDVVPGTNQDELVSTGTLAITGGGSPFVLTIVRSAGEAWDTIPLGTTFVVANAGAITLSTLNGGNPIADTSSATENAIAAAFTVTDYTAPGTPAEQWQAEVEPAGDGTWNLDVTVTSTPEPGSLGLLGIASLGLLRRRRAFGERMKAKV